MVIADLQARLATARERFRKLYGDGPVSVLRAPARINILGEHVDYVSYLPTASLPFGSHEHAMFMLFRGARDGRVRGVSTLDAYEPFAFALGDGPEIGRPDQAERSWLAYLYNRPLPAPHWANYVKGAVYFAQLKHGPRVNRGFDSLIDSSIPPGGGASSSSALTVLAGAAIREVNKIEYRLDQLARESAQAEWYLGVRGGAMDQTTICLAERHHAVHIAYPSHRAELVPLPDRGFRWVTFFSHPAEKGGGVMLEYNERSAVSRLVIPAILDDWNDHRPALAESRKRALEEMKSDPIAGLDKLESLLGELPAEVVLAELERSDPELVLECRREFPTLIEARREQPLKLRARALHHVAEARRVVRAVGLLAEVFGDENTRSTGQVESGMRELGALINASHSSLRDLYEVCTPEVSRLVEIILSEPVVYGARLMGGGFGGNVLALTGEEMVASLIARIQAKFYQPRGRDGLREGAVMISTAGDGLSWIQ